MGNVGDGVRAANTARNERKAKAEVRKRQLAEAERRERDRIARQQAELKAAFLERQGQRAA